MTFCVPEEYRVLNGRLASTKFDGNNGAFCMMGPCGRWLNIIASDGAGWEHVSVSLPKHCPNWEEMCFVKRRFWSDDATVIQYHPARADYVNFHQFCLHLWRPIGVELPKPPSILVGPQSA